MYREMGMSIKDIRLILDDEETIEKHLYKQVKALNDEIK